LTTVAVAPQSVPANVAVLLAANGKDMELAGVSLVAATAPPPISVLSSTRVSARNEKIRVGRRDGMLPTINPPGPLRKYVSADDNRAISMIGAYCLTGESCAADRTGRALAG